MQFSTFESLAKDLVKCDSSHDNITAADIAADFEKSFPELKEIYYSVNQRFISDKDDFDILKMVFFMHTALVQIYSTYQGKPVGASTTFMCALMFGLYMGQTGLMRVEKGDPYSSIDDEEVKKAMEKILSYKKTQS